MAFDQSRNTEPPLLRTKISAPLIPPEYVHRGRLTEWIDRGVMGPLTLLAAPAGYGKTNLLIEWMKTTSLRVAWLNLDMDDNNVNSFFRYLIGAFQTLEPHLGEEALDFIQSTRGSGLEMGLTFLINEISALPTEIVLVLDDFQVVQESAVLQGIGFLLKRLPCNLHVVIASRGEPALDLVLLRAKGLMVELDVEDLRFTSEEVAQYFQGIMGLHLTPEVVQALAKRTEGWITGLQMAAISLRHQSDPASLLANLNGSAHYLVDFWAEEVLDRQPEEVRQFLLKSSILDTLSGSLCEAVVKPDAQPGYGTVMLNKLERARLFITALDEEHEWFRYHHLFADFLRHVQSENNPLEIPELQKRASLWFEQNLNLDEAFKYALASGDMEWTANLVERNIEMMVKTGVIFSLTRWIGKLPDELIRQRPRLSLIYAWGALAAYDLDNARYWVNVIQQTLDQVEGQNGQAQTQSELETARSYESTGLWNIRGGLAVCQSTLALFSGNVERATNLSKKAASDLGKDNPFIQSLMALDDSLYYILSGDTQKAIESLRKTIWIARRANNLLVMIVATCQLAEMQAMQGQLSLAWITLQKVQYMAIGPGGKPLPLAGLADIGFGEILLERNLLEEAYVYLERGIKTSGSLWWLGNLDGMVSLARLLQAKGDIASSQNIIASASRMALNTESSQWDDVIVSAIAVRMALSRGDLLAAEQWWKKGAFPDFSKSIPLENYPYHVYEYLVFTQARLLANIGKSQGNESYLRRSIELVEPLLLEARQFRRLTSQVEIQVLLAAVQFTLGEVQQAVETIRVALAVAEPEGYKRIFLDGGPVITQLLAHYRSGLKSAESTLPSIEFVDSLLADMNGIAPVIIPQAMGKPAGESFVAQSDYGLPVSLSSREMEVLALIAEGKSNQEISAKLYLALNTVKRHAYNIYAKLEVKKRTQAVSRARQLGLIP